MKLRNSLVTLLDSTFNRTSSLFGAMSRALDEMDAETELARFQERSNSLMETGNKMFSGFSGFLRQIKENSNLFVVRVPFDETKEEISHTIENGILTVTKFSSTKNSKSESKTTSTIPEECDVNGLKTYHNKKKKIMAYVFPKTKKQSDFADVD